MKDVTLVKLSELGESSLLEIIKEYLTSFQPRPWLDIGDDCAAWKSNANKISLVTADILIEGIHF